VCVACLHDRLRAGVRFDLPWLSRSQPWPAFRQALAETWAETTRCANWLLDGVLRARCPRATSDDRLRPMPASYLYPEVARVVPTYRRKASRSCTDRPPHLSASGSSSLWTRTRTSRLSVHRHRSSCPRSVATPSAMVEAPGCSLPIAQPSLDASIAERSSAAVTTVSELTQLARSDARRGTLTLSGSRISRDHRAGETADDCR